MNMMLEMVINSAGSLELFRGWDILVEKGWWWRLWLWCQWWILKNIDIDIDMVILENIDIDIDMDFLEYIDIDIDIDKGILQNIDIDKILYRLEFGISNRAKDYQKGPLLFLSFTLIKSAPVISIGVWLFWRQTILSNFNLEDKFEMEQRAISTRNYIIQFKTGIKVSNFMPE